MKSERRKKKKKRNKPWTPRVPCLIPPGKRWKSRKDYNRKEGKRIPNEDE